MFHFCRTVPRGAHVVFRVGVVGERFAVPIEIDAVGVAQPAAEHLDLLAILVHA